MVMWKVLDVHRHQAIQHQRCRTVRDQDRDRQRGPSHQQRIERCSASHFLDLANLLCLINRLFTASLIDRSARVNLTISCSLVSGPAVHVQMIVHAEYRGRAVGSWPESLRHGQGLSGNVGRLWEATPEVVADDPPQSLGT